MSELIDWFTREIRELDFAGLEGVYDYLATMSDAEVLEYLESLLGSDERIAEFATSYIQRRSQGTRNEPSAAPQSSPSDEDFDWARTTRVPPKAKRTTGNHRKAEKKSKQSQREDKSFANVVSNANASASNTEQAKAIRDAPVERMREQVREYRKTKRPINCIHCGKIECPVQEDGACSFCKSPIFSIWSPSGHRQGATRFTQTQSEGETLSGTTQKKLAADYCVVFGRYVRRPIRYKNIYLQPGLRDLAGNKRYGTHLAANVQGANNLTHSGTSDANSSDSIPLDSKERSERPVKEAMPTRKSGSSSYDDAFSVQGRLLVDDMRPSVCLPDL